MCVCFIYLYIISLTAKIKNKRVFVFGKGALGVGPNFLNKDNLEETGNRPYIIYNLFVLFYKLKILNNKF